MITVHKLIKDCKKKKKSITFDIYERTSNDQLNAIRDTSKVIEIIVRHLLV